MFRHRYKTFLAICALFALPVFALAGPKNISTKKHDHQAAKSAVSHKNKFSHVTHHHELTPVEMPAERATQIQTALIQKGYMTGAPTGSWDAQTIAAMQKMQGDNGWQTKITPDSRALIKLGLGPRPTAEMTDHTQDMAQTISH